MSKQYPYKAVKIRGTIDALDKHYVYATLYADCYEFWAKIDRKDFGPEASRLVPGALISHPAKRGARWTMVWMPPMTKREILRAERWAKRISKWLKREEE